MRGWKRRLAGVMTAVAVVAFGAVGASADSVLQFDVNQASAQAYTGFGGTGSTTGFSASHTGSLVMSMDADTAFSGLFIDGVFHGLTGTFALSAFSVTIDFVAGDIVGGSYSISVTDAGLTTDTFTASIFDNNGAGTSNIDGPNGGNFDIDGGVAGGTFSGPTFGGIDVSDFDSREPLFGSIIEFFYSPDGSGFDEDADVDLFVVIPAPPAVLWGLAGLTGLVVSRKRLAKLV